MTTRKYKLWQVVRPEQYDRRIPWICTKEFEAEIQLREVTSLWGVPVWSRILDREDYPVWAFINQCCTGSSGWQSRLREQYKELLK